MSESPLDRLTIEFLDWVARRPRTYDEAMETWRTTCPRLTVWEDALMGGLIRVDRAGSRSESFIALTPEGQAALNERRESPRA